MIWFPDEKKQERIHYQKKYRQSFLIGSQD